MGRDWEGDYWVAREGMAEQRASIEDQGSASPITQSERAGVRSPGRGVQEVQPRLIPVTNVPS